MTQPFHLYRQYKRIYSKQVVTENGIYKEGEVPSAKQGDAQLTVEVVHEIILADAAGQLIRLVFHIPEALDQNDEKGGSYTLDGSSITTDDYPAGSGPSTVPTALYTDTSSTLTSDNVISATEMENVANAWAPT